MSAPWGLLHLKDRLLNQPRRENAGIRPTPEGPPPEGPSDPDPCHPCARSSFAGPFRPHQTFGELGAWVRPTRWRWPHPCERLPRRPTRHAPSSGWRTEIGWPVFREAPGAPGRPGSTCPASRWRPGAGSSRVRMYQVAPRALHRPGVLAGQEPGRCRGRSIVPHLVRGIHPRQMTTARPAVHEGGSMGRGGWTQPGELHVATARRAVRHPPPGADPRREPSGTTSACPPRGGRRPARAGRHRPPPPPSSSMPWPPPGW